MAKKQAYTPPQKSDEHDVLIAALKEDISAKAQQIANQQKAIQSLNDELAIVREEAREVKQDYMEIAETIAAAATVSHRIILRHDIGRTTHIAQGTNRPIMS